MQSNKKKKAAEHIKTNKKKIDKFSSALPLEANRQQTCIFTVNVSVSLVHGHGDVFAGPTGPC